MVLLELELLKLSRLLDDSSYDMPVRRRSFTSFTIAIMMIAGLGIG